MSEDELSKLCQLCTTDELSCQREPEEIHRITSLFNFVSVECTNYDTCMQFCCLRSHRFSNKNQPIITLHLFSFQEIDVQLGICDACFHTLNKFALFSEQCMKAKEVFEYLRSLSSIPDDLESIRIDMGLRVEKVHQSTDTNDLSMNIKNEEFEGCQRDGKKLFILTSFKSICYCANFFTSRINLQQTNPTT